MEVKKEEKKEEKSLIHSSSSTDEDRAVIREAFNAFNNTHKKGTEISDKAAVVTAVGLLGLTGVGLPVAIGAATVIRIIGYRTSGSLAMSAYDSKEKEIRERQEKEKQKLLETKTSTTIPEKKQQLIIDTGIGIPPLGLMQTPDPSPQTGAPKRTLTSRNFSRRAFNQNSHPFSFSSIEEKKHSFGKQPEFATWYFDFVNKADLIQEAIKSHNLKFQAIILKTVLSTPGPSLNLQKNIGQLLLHCNCTQLIEEMVPNDLEIKKCDQFLNLAWEGLVGQFSTMREMDVSGCS